jgi:hypothetical protein
VEDNDDELVTPGVILNGQEIEVDIVLYDASTRRHEARD